MPRVRRRFGCFAENDAAALHGLPAAARYAQASARKVRAWRARRVRSAACLPVTMLAAGVDRRSTSPATAASVRKPMVVSKVILRSGEGSENMP